MKYLIILSLLLSGCASDKTIMQNYASHYNNLDTCQYNGKPEGYVLPKYCFVNSGKTVYYVRNTNNQLVYTVR